MKNPLRKLWDTCKFALRVLIVSAGRYSADQHNQRAVALTYYTLFAIVPIAALSFGIAKGFDMENRLRQVLDSRFSQHEELLKYVYQFADTTLKQASGGLVAGVGVIALIWTVMWLAGNIEKAFNAVWGLPPRKNLLRKFSDYLAIVLLMPIILVIMGSAGVFMRALFNNLSNKLAFLGSAPGYLLNLAGSLTPLVIAIDGRSASGKTTLANQLKIILNAQVIHMDDFFLPLAMRTEMRYNEAGGNVHYERFKEEVLPNLKKPNAFSYRIFDCKKKCFNGNRMVWENSSWRIVEGAYSHHRQFGNYADLKIFYDIDPAEQMRRINNRNGAQAAKAFQSKWIPLEEKYIRTFSVDKNADLIIR